MKTLCVIILLLLFCLLARAQSLPIPTNSPGSVTLGWTASTTSPVAYTIYYGPASATYTNTVSAGTNLTVTVSNLVRGATYWFAAIATATNGLVSPPSNEISYQPALPPAPPTVFRVIVGN